MATVSRGLPDRPHLDVPKRQARELLEGWRQRQPDVFDRIRHQHPRYRTTLDSELAAATFRLSDAQLVIAREYGFVNWADLKRRIEVSSSAQALAAAIRADDRVVATQLIRLQPQLLHLPLVSANWGPPMSHAANLGRLEMIQALAALGARDFQHAFERAVLRGRIECAHWLKEHGAQVVPGIVLGPCETLNSAGLKFLTEGKAPYVDGKGDRLAPLALVLETYTRNPAGKAEILRLFEQQGYKLPDTPILAFHRGDVSGLERHYRRDPGLIHRRFTLSEIFPSECGCAVGGQSGMHWTPIHGTTLLHLAVDYRELEIFEWLLSRGADVNAPATLDSDGFGGHTPLFNAVVAGPWPDAAFARRLVESGANTKARASLRKFLDWIEEPHWFEARNVTALEWGRDFPEKNWINQEALALLMAGE